MICEKCGQYDMKPKISEFLAEFKEGKISQDEAVERLIYLARERDALEELERIKLINLEPRLGKIL